MVGTLQFVLHLTWRQPLHWALSAWVWEGSLLREFLCSLSQSAQQAEPEKMQESYMVDAKMNFLIIRMSKHWKQLVREGVCRISILKEVVPSWEKSLWTTYRWLDMTGHTEGGQALLWMRGKGVAFLKIECGEWSIHFCPKQK